MRSTPLPAGVAQHHDGRARTGSLLVRRERPAEDGSRSERCEEVRRDHLDQHLPRAVAVVDGREREVVRRELREQIPVLAQRRDLRVRKCPVLAGPGGITRVEAGNHARRMARQRFEQEPVDQNEGRRRRADAERQHGQRDSRERPIPGQQPQAEPHVASDGPNGPNGAGKQRRGCGVPHGER